MKHILFGVRYVFEHHVLKKNTPLICGLVLTNKCNLNCRHCRVTKRDAPAMGFEEAIDVLESFYDEGGRALYLEGGEPFIWRDGNHNMEDIVVRSRKIGFLTTVIYTNGTVPLETSADTVFISVDGSAKTHDFLRGGTFDKIMNNILNSKHPSLYINYTINNYNKNELEDFCEHIKTVNQIRGIFFYFHTPYYGYDDLYIETEERKAILLTLLDLKNKYRILNSRAGLKSALNNNWKRPLNICRVYESGRVYTCCRFSGDPVLCENCGYLSYPEINEVLSLRPSAVFNALRYF